MPPSSGWMLLRPGKPQIHETSTAQPEISAAAAIIRDAFSRRSAISAERVSIDAPIGHDIGPPHITDQYEGLTYRGVARLLAACVRTRQMVRRRQGEALRRRRGDCWRRL